MLKVMVKTKGYSIIKILIICNFYYPDHIVRFKSTKFVVKVLFGGFFDISCVLSKLQKFWLIYKNLVQVYSEGIFPNLILQCAVNSGDIGRGCISGKFITVTAAMNNAFVRIGLGKL